MESSHVDLDYVFNKHECDQCDSRSIKERTIEKLRQGAEDQCPASGLWVTYIDWAGPELLEYSDFERRHMRNKFSVEIYESYHTLLCLVLFRIEGKSAKQLLRGKE
jgi:hypothetical protein